MIIKYKNILPYSEFLMKEHTILGERTVILNLI